MKQIFKTIKNAIFPKTLYGRSLAIIVVPVLLMQLIVGYIFLERPWDNLVDKLAFSISGEIYGINEQINHAGDDKVALQNIINAAKDDLAITISFNKYKTVDKSKNRPISFVWKRIEEKLREKLDKKLKAPFNIITFPDAGSFEVNILLENNKVITYSCSRKRITSPATHIFILWLIGTSVFLMAVAILFMKNQLRPIRRLAVAAEKLGKGQDIHNFKVEGASEVRQASRAFLEMRGRIKKQIEQRTAMLAGVSHDLKTPITRMKLQLAMMKDLPDVEHFLQDIQEMENMLEGYLAFARGDGDEETESVSIRNILDRIISKSKREGHELEHNFNKDFMLNIRPLAMERAIGNIIGNSCKYAGKTWIEFSKKDKDILEIIIEDNGPGIPKERREDVFKPFYRLEKSRNTKTGGIGLGLSIAQDIINGHGGEIVLDDSKRGGLKVVLHLPI